MLLVHLNIHCPTELTVFHAQLMLCLIPQVEAAKIVGLDRLLYGMMLIHQCALAHNLNISMVRIVSNATDLSYGMQSH